MRMLDLSHNNLQQLDNKTHSLLGDCLSLEKVNLSYNQISFISSKTFPESPWIPYRLAEIDLSYNIMPVLTKEIIIGTKKAIKINLRGNMIAEIRPGTGIYHVNIFHFISTVNYFSFLFAQEYFRISQACNIWIFRIMN